MAIRSGFFNSVNGDRKYDAKRFAEYFNSFIGNGVFPNPSNNLQVMANDNMTVTLKAGKAWIDGYILINDDDYVLEIDVADGVLNRIDRIVARYDTVDREITLEVKKGAFASTPTAPILQRDADAFELGIADIYVGKGAISITQANITDLRLNNEVCGIVHGTVEQVDTTTLFAQYESWYNQTIGQAGIAFENMQQQLEQDFLTWFATLQDILDENTAANLLNMINATNDNLSNLSDDLVAHKADTTSYSTYKLNPDSEGIFTEIQYKRPNGTLILKSVLSGGTSPEYTTRTETKYEQDGITVKDIRIYTITYADGKVVSEVLQ